MTACSHDAHCKRSSRALRMDQHHSIRRVRDPRRSWTLFYVALGRNLLRDAGSHVWTGTTPDDLADMLSQKGFSQNGWSQNGHP